MTKQPSAAKGRLGIGGLVLLCASTSFGATLYSYGLPTSNVNTGPGIQSNADVASYNINGTMDGDSFSLTSAATVRSISIFAVANSTGDSSASAFAAEFGGMNAIDLFFGDPTQYPSGCSTATAAGDCNFAQIATASLITPVLLPGTPGGCSGYLAQTSPDVCLPIFQITFNVNLNLLANTAYGFAANAVYSGSGTCVRECDWYDLGSTSPGGAFGTLQTQAYAGTSPGFYLNWDTADLTGGSLYCSTTGGAGGDSCFSDYNFNLNVILSDSSAVPEPTLLIPSGLTLGIMALVAIRRRKAARQRAS